MSRHTVEESAERDLTLDRDDRACPECGRRMDVRCRRLRFILTLDGPLRLSVGLVVNGGEKSWRLAGEKCSALPEGIPRWSVADSSLRGGLFITSTWHRSRLSPSSSVFVAPQHEVGSSGRRFRGCDSGAVLRETVSTRESFRRGTEISLFCRVVESAGMSFAGSVSDSFHGTGRFLRFAMS